MTPVIMLKPKRTPDMIVRKGLKSDLSDVFSLLTEGKKVDSTYFCQAQWENKTDLAISSGIIVRRSLLLDAVGDQVLPRCFKSPTPALLKFHFRFSRGIKES